MEFGDTHDPRLHESSPHWNDLAEFTGTHIDLVADTSALQAVPPSSIPGGWLIAGLLISGFCVILMMVRASLSINATAPANALVVLGAGLAIGARFAFRSPQNEWQRTVRDGAEYIGLFALICLMGVVASYPAAAESSGFADRSLEHIDRLLGFDWVRWYDFIASHPLLQLLGSWAYASIYVSPVLLLGHFAIAGRQAQARLFMASFWFAAILTLILFIAFPARGPLAYLWRGPIPYMPTSALYQAVLIPILRAHALHQIGLDALRGLVCVPSFHTESAVLYIAAAWPIARLRWPILAMNIAMLLSTPVEGTHYLSDMLGGALVALFALGTVRLLTSQRWSPVVRVRPLRASTLRG